VLTERFPKLVAAVDAAKSRDALVKK
jgi:hypothetical protein